MSTLDRQTIISELILAGADKQTLEYAKTAPLANLLTALDLQRRINAVVTDTHETEATYRQLAMRSRKA